MGFVLFTIRPTNVSIISCKHFAHAPVCGLAMLSQPAQSSEPWGNWRVVRASSLRMIISCFHGDFSWFHSDFCKMWKDWGSSGPQPPALVITLINNHDQSVWWMELNPCLMVSGLGRRGGGGLGRDIGTRGAGARRTGVKWTVLLHCNSTHFLSVGNLSPHVVVCVFLCAHPVQKTRTGFEWVPQTFCGQSLVYRRRGWPGRGSRGIILCVRVLVPGRCGIM